MMKNDTSEDYIDPMYLKKAYKTFRKRLRLTRLDAESTLGSGALSGGQKSGIVAIRPPTNFPQEVWDKLVKMGKLRTEGMGLYELVEDLGPLGKKGSIEIYDK
ncbi:ABC-type polar amino acid transport system, ATPase component [Candidatus Scalindua japonica]|uniref:ABC-type polar amino acid transport system, ATPase component n=1 Tax=Candidatus Scalindua japonica TaxID=1284222 RepID=A0A286TYR9_9BACT|nr:hypothetical protein [Candidatus Scalindua japonica]GAX61032.1 ABC-type polar amino acid transport system, ATPase component [Candidatus Scalindua japonica]